MRDGMGYLSNRKRESVQHNNNCIAHSNESFQYLLVGRKCSLSVVPTQSIVRPDRSKPNHQPRRPVANYEGRRFHSVRMSIVHRVVSRSLASLVSEPSQPTSGVGRVNVHWAGHVQMGVCPAPEQFFSTHNPGIYKKVMF